MMTAFWFPQNGTRISESAMYNEWMFLEDALNTLNRLHMSKLHRLHSFAFG
jgi:hypothetical protein